MTIWYPIGYHVAMTAATAAEGSVGRGRAGRGADGTAALRTWSPRPSARLLSAARRRSGLGLRELARRAGTSHATLHAYERGDKEPRVDTVERIARAAGFALELALTGRADPEDQRVAKGEELHQALLLAAAFPARHRPRLDAPVFGPA